MRRVLWLGVFGALAVFAALWALVWWLLGWIDPASVWGLSTLIEWFGEYFDWIAGFAFAGVMLVATFLLFPAVVTILVGLLLDQVVDAVEAKHYPGLGQARKQSIGEILVTTIKFAAILILLNLLALPFYILLIFIPGANLILYYVLNGYLIGREYFELVAYRRLEPGEAVALRRRNRAYVFAAGVTLTFLMTIPVVNLIAPVVGAAFMVHATYDLMRRRGVPLAVEGPAESPSGE